MKLRKKVVNLEYFFPNTSNNYNTCIYSGIFPCRCQKTQVVPSHTFFLTTWWGFSSGLVAWIWYADERARDPRRWWWQRIYQTRNIIGAEASLIKGGFKKILNSGPILNILRWFWNVKIWRRLVSNNPILHDQVLELVLDLYMFFLVVCGAISIKCLFDLI